MPAGARTVEAERRDRADHERGALAPERGDVDAERRPRLRPAGFHDEVGGSNEMPQPLDLRRVLKVDDDAALSGVEVGEQGAALEIPGLQRYEPARGIAGRSFDLHDVGAVGGEEARAEGAGDVGAEVNHTEAIEQRHGSLPFDVNGG